jgi:NADPH:quinone reductase-like Zn-dependent oxidoreductase
MKIIELLHYGSKNNLKISERKTPVIKNDEILVKVHASTVTRVDSIFRLGHEFFARMYTGIFKSKIKILGTELSGEVVQVGKNVSNFKLGDKVFVACEAAHVEFIALNEHAAVQIMPHNLSYTEAAAVPAGALTALPFLRDAAKIANGDKVLINGASGSIGSYAVQLAKHYGAEVTAVSSKENHDLVKSLGADFVIDYKTDDFTQNKNSYDIIFDTVGKSSYSKAQKSLKKNGRYLNPVINFALLFQMLVTSFFSKKKALFVATGMRKDSDKQADLKLIKELIEENKIKVVIDKTFELHDVELAYKHVDQGHKKGNVVIKIGYNL